MRTTKTIREIKKSGFIRIGQTEYFINNTGICYNRATDHQHQPNNIKTESGLITREAAVLWAFKKQKPRKNAKTRHINGNIKDFAPENLEYVTKITAKPEILDIDGLTTAIKKYIYVSKGFRANKDKQETRIYLKMIAEKYNFGEEWKKNPFFKVFQHYLNTFETIRETAKKNKLTTADTQKAITSQLNRLAKEINSTDRKELEAVTKKRKKTIKTALKEWNETIEQYK